MTLMKQKMNARHRQTRESKNIKTKKIKWLHHSFSCNSICCHFQLKFFCVSCSSCLTYIITYILNLVYYVFRRKLTTKKKYKIATT